MEDRLLTIFKENGLEIQLNEKYELLEYDSIQFVSLIVDIESEFDIELPEDMLTYDKLICFQDFYNLVLHLTSTNTDDNKSN